MRSVVSTLAILGLASAASDFGGNPHSVGNPYFYSEINSSEYDAETDGQSQHANDEFTETSSQVVGSLTFDGGCFVSAQAIMCHGGGSDPMALLGRALLDSDLEYSDDEDDDEDDGHSSMLSNASLRRTKALVGGSAASTSRSTRSNQQSHTDGTATYYEGEIQLQRNPAATRAALQLRSGLISSISERDELTQKRVVGAIVALLFGTNVGRVVEFCKIVTQTPLLRLPYRQALQENNTRNRN